MGARLRDRIRQAARVGRGLAALLAALALCACGASEQDARDTAAKRLEHGARVIAADLELRLKDCFEALQAVDAALEDTALEDAALRDTTAPGARFDALESLRTRYDLSGLLWEGRGAERAWAGRQLDAAPLPARPPWHHSFRSGLTHYHAGPFVQALLVGPIRASGGHARATAILAEESPDEMGGERFEKRWLEPLGLSEVRLVHPAEAPDTAGESCCRRRVEIKAPDGTVVLTALLRVHGLEALREQVAADMARTHGIVLLLLLFVLTWLCLRYGLPRIRTATLRWLAGGALVLLFREALKLLELPDRFSALRLAFSPSEFAIETPLGWLSSPADFALTAIGYLFVALCVMRAIDPLPIPRRGLGRLATAAAALAVCALVTGLWLLVVDAAVDGGQTPFFEAHSFIPSASSALMLLGLVAVTATTYLVTHLVLRRALRSLPPLPRPLGRLGLALAAALVTWWAVGPLADPTWIVFIIPLIAAALVDRSEGRVGMELPSRVLITSVLATALAYPVLWTRVSAREDEGLEETLQEMLDSEDLALAGVALALNDARDDVYLRSALRESATGGRPEGLALYLWLRSASHWQRQASVVTVLDARGRRLDKFSLATLPRKLLPSPKPPVTPDSDDEVFVARSDGTKLRCVVGRLRLRGEDGAVIGHVVMTVADRMDLHLKGLGGLAITARDGNPRPAVTGGRLQFAELREGRVVASSDPTVGRAAGAFGPPHLAHLSEAQPYFDWANEDEQGFALFSRERGTVFAVRRETASLSDALLALARLIVVGVGLGLAATVGCLLYAMKGAPFRLQLHHKILLSYFVISVIPLMLLGLASAREVQQRHDSRLTDRIESDIARVRSELELLGAGVFDSADSDRLEKWAPQRRHDTLLYRDGELQSASRMGLVDAELLSARLPAVAYRATVLERRQIVRREAVYAGRRVWFGYAPVLDGAGRTRATLGVPLLYKADRVEREVTVWGSVLVAAYMFTIVLVLVGGLFTARRLTRPLKSLAEGTRRVAAGDLEVRLEGAGQDEFGQLVTDFNAMTRALGEATSRARRAERESAWRKMASQVAHEIKNPLTPMRLLLQQMQADVARDPTKGSETITRTAPKVLRQIEELGRIARDFASFARLPKRRLTTVDTGALIEEVTALHSGAIEQGIQVRCEVAAGVPTVTWDADELRRVLLNLVLNALESIEGPGEVVLEARPLVRQGQRGVGLTIRDNGAGIEPDHLSRLFEPQFSTKTRGTGLGLAIVSRTVDDMGGTITVESEVGRGTTFTLWWPGSEETP